MKKDLIFAPALLVIGVVLFLLRLTGMPAHIGVSVAGAVVLGAYTVLTVKEWKLPALEIVMRACYGFALISGIAVINLSGIVAIAILHRVLASLFLASLLGLFVHKLIKR